MPQKIQNWSFYHNFSNNSPHAIDSWLYNITLLDHNILKKIYSQTNLGFWFLQQKNRKTLIEFQKHFSSWCN